VGAGVAGLAAAAALRRAGRRCTVLEAAGRIGGRAFTTRPAALGGALFDHGASWLHAAERNPLVAIARAHGDALRDADTIRTWRSFVGGRAASAGELADYDAAEARFAAAMAERAAQGGPDTSLAQAASALPDDPWNATVLAWEALIAAADADALSFRDWHANTLEGSNLLVAGGLGRFVVRRLGAAAGPVVCSTPARRIEWQRRGGVRVVTDRGTIEAGACIVTVSTGVLASGVIAFDPALPPPTQAAVRLLPMGLLTKIALRATGEDRLDLPPRCAAHRQVAPGEALTVFNCWPDGADHVIGFLGGGLAWELERAGPRAAEAHARAELRRMLGTRADRAFDRASLATRWGSDPFIRGAYCYPGPGDAGARLELARPLADGALVFAGEACHPTLGGTVGGAFLSGERAVRLARFCDRGKPSALATFRPER